MIKLKKIKQESNERNKININLIYLNLKKIL